MKKKMIEDLGRILNEEVIDRNKIQEKREFLNEMASKDAENIEEAISESLIDRMVLSMVEAPKFVKILESIDKYIGSSELLKEDIATSVKNALVLVLKQHDAEMAGSLAGKAKRDMKKDLTTGA